MKRSGIYKIFSQIESNENKSFIFKLAQSMKHENKDIISEKYVNHKGAPHMMTLPN